MNRVILMAMAIFALTAIFAACTTEVVKEVPVEVVVEKEVVKTVEVPGQTITKEVIVEREADPGKLVIYSGRKESLIGSIIEEFEDLTGIDVDAKYGRLSRSLL